MFDLSVIAPELVRLPDGMWVSAAPGRVSYPDSGNASCFAVEESSFWFQHRNRCITALVSAWPPPGGGPLLDVGAGNGVVTAALLAAGHMAIALEPGETGAANALRRGVPLVIRARLEEVAFRPASLAAVGLFDVLEHIERDEAFLAELRALLPVGGRLFLTVPASQWLWSVDDEYAGHWRRYSLATLERRLSTAGFRVEYASCFFAALVLPILLFRTLPSRVGARRRGDAASVREHREQGGLVAGLVEALLQLELKRLVRGRVLPFGASAVAVATAV